jgi:glutathione S-transferase
MEVFTAQYQEIFGAIGGAYLSKDDAKIKESIQDKAGPFIAKIEGILGNTKWLCSNDKLTVADFWIGTLYTDHCVN